MLKDFVKHYLYSSSCLLYVVSYILVLVALLSSSELLTHNQFGTDSIDEDQVRNIGVSSRVDGLCT